MKDAFRCAPGDRAHDGGRLAASAGDGTVRLIPAPASGSVVLLMPMPVSKVHASLGGL